ncbi:MAG: M24 family metallopeptidase [Bacillota bacterium]
MSCAELYEAAARVAGKHGLKDHFTGYPEPVAFIGHGIGIELDELPALARGFDKPLEKNMVFALEPKFVFPEGAVGIENTFLVTEKGLDSLMVFDDNIIRLP